MPAGLNDVVAIAAGGFHSLALKSDGTIVAWGDNGNGQSTVPGSNELSGLTLQEGSLDKPFSPSVTSYTYGYIGPPVSSVHVTAKLADPSLSDLYVNNQLQASDSAATVSVSGASTVIPVRVEPYFEPPQTYNLTVLRDAAAPNIQFNPNGNASPAMGAASTVTVTDNESGVDAASLQYAWTQSAVVPSGGWTAFANGDALEQASGDGIWYLHVRATDQVGNVADAVSNAFALDNSPPAVSIGSTTSGTVNAAFPVTITFSEPVTGFSANGILASNGTVSSFAAIGPTAYSATVTPITSGQAVTVQVASDAAFDTAGNGNAVSNPLSLAYDTTKPMVTFGGFFDNQTFAAPPNAVTVSVSEAVYWAADGAELTSSNAFSLIRMKKNNVAFAAYASNYDAVSHTFTLTFNGNLDDGIYEIYVAGDVVKNERNNLLDAASASFTVAVPQITGISVDPASFNSAGGSATVTITGANLIGQTVKIDVDGAEAATAVVHSAASATAALTIAQNGTSNVINHTLTVKLNGAEVAGRSATVTVSGSSGVSGVDSSPAVAMPVIDQNGVMLDPATIDTAKPFVTLQVTPKDGAAYVSIPASILTNMAGKNATFFIEIKTPYGSYQIPVNLASLIPGLQDLLVKNNLTAKEISFKITLTDQSSDKDIQAAFAGRFPNGRALGAIVDFHMDILNARTGQTIGTADQFSDALTRIIPMPKNVTSMPEQWGAFRYNEATRKFEFVAAQSEVMDGTRYVMIRSYANSVYAVAANPIGFADMQKHWSLPFVRLAAAKGLVEGIGGGKYDPDKAVTRAEFTAMLVRALGRGTSASGSALPYDDVLTDAWYVDEIAKAKALGLLGFADGTRFKPEQPLNRDEMASMLAAAIKLEKLPMPEKMASLDGYKDSGSIKPAYLDDLRLMATLQIMTGTSASTFDPAGKTTRAQAAAVFIRTLQTIGLMDK